MCSEGNIEVDVDVKNKLNIKERSEWNELNAALFEF